MISWRQIYVLLVVVGIFVRPVMAQIVRFERTYGGVSAEDARHVERTFDGGYLVTGNTNSTTSGNKMYVIRTDAAGDTLWTRSLGGEMNDYCYAARQTTAGQYILVGTTFNDGDPQGDISLFHLDERGFPQWSRHFGGEDWDQGTSVAEIDEGGYIVAGFSHSFGPGSSIYLIRTDPNGDTLWTRSFAPTGEDRAFAVRRVSDGGYVVAGVSGLTFSSGDIVVLKISRDGDLVWSRVISGLGLAIGYDVRQTADGGFVLVGGRDLESARPSLYLARLSSTGDTLWTRTIGGEEVRIGYAIQETRYGGFIVAGRTGSAWDADTDALLLTTDRDGNINWSRRFGGSGFEELRSVGETPDGYVATGRTSSFGAGSFDVYLIKTDESGVVHVGDSTPQLTSGFFLHQNYPNPFNPRTRIRYEIARGGRVHVGLYTLLGESLSTLVDAEQMPGTFEVEIDGSSFASGLYVCRLQTGGSVQSRKLLLVK